MPEKTAHANVTVAQKAGEETFGNEVRSYDDGFHSLLRVAQSSAGKNTTKQ